MNHKYREKTYLALRRIYIVKGSSITYRLRKSLIKNSPAYAAIATCLLAPITAMQFYVTTLQLHMAKVDERPWLKVDIIPNSDLVFNDPENGVGTAGIWVKIKVTNIGKTPAMAVTPKHGVHDARLYKDKIDIEIQKNCSVFTKLSEIKDVENVTIFPNQDIFFSKKLIIPSDEINKLYDSSTLPPGVTPVVYGCVGYKTTFDSEWHQTDFSYAIVNPYSVLIGRDKNKVDKNEMIPIAFTIPKHGSFAD